jgi:hypothetical protein
MTNVRWTTEYGSWVGDAYGYFRPSELGIENMLTHQFEPDDTSGVSNTGISKCLKCGVRVYGLAAAYNVGRCPA